MICLLMLSVKFLRSHSDPSYRSHVKRELSFAIQFQDGIHLLSVESADCTGAEVDGAAGNVEILADVSGVQRD